MITIIFNIYTSTLGNKCKHSEMSLIDIIHVKYINTIVFFINLFDINLIM